jgi:phage FluMu protein Com
MQPEPVTQTASGDARCPCGGLVARLIPGGVELKCRRCRRLLIVPMEDSGETRSRTSGRGGARGRL